MDIKWNNSKVIQYMYFELLEKDFIFQEYMIFFHKFRLKYQKNVNNKNCNGFNLYLFEILFQLIRSTGPNYFVLIFFKAKTKRKKKEADISKIHIV